MGRPLDEMSLTVTRRPGAWTDGSWIPGTTSTFALLASRPQPLGAEEIEMLSAGARTKAKFVIFAHDDQPALYTVEHDQVDHEADLVTYNGRPYTTIGDGDWTGRPLGHHRYILLAPGPDEVPS